MKTYQVNKCECDFLISSSNSQVESPVLCILDDFDKID